MRHCPDATRRPIAQPRVLLLAAVLPCVCFSANAALRTTTPEALRVEIAQLQTLTSMCAADASACKATQVGPDETGGAPGQPGSYSVHWNWLRNALTNAAEAKTADRTANMQAALAHLNSLAVDLGDPASTPTQLTQARTTVNDILSRKEFQQADAPTWWERQKARFWAWLANAFHGVDNLGTKHPWLGRTLEWLLFTGATVGLLLLVRRSLVQQRLRVSLTEAAMQRATWQREPTAWAELAHTHAARGEWRDAVHCLYWAAIVLLESRRAWSHDPTRTPREYLRLLAPQSSQHRILRALTRLFEQLWYGQQAATEADFTRARSLFHELESTDHSTSAAVPIALPERA